MGLLMAPVKATSDVADDVLAAASGGRGKVKTKALMTEPKRVLRHAGKVETNEAWNGDFTS